MDMKIIDNLGIQSDHFWYDALNVALATHPDQNFRELAGVVPVEQAERILDVFPDGLFSLVRRALDVMARKTMLCSPDHEEAIEFINSVLRGKHPGLDHYILASSNH